MDFGAVICKPAAPLCGECPLQKKCYAFLNNKVSVLPINEKVIRQKERFFNYLIIEYRQKFYVKERTAKDIWQNLFEFILIETTSLLQVSALLKSEPCREIFETSQFVVFNVSENYFQKLTHQRIFGRFLHIKITRPLKESGNYQLISKAELTTLPFPKFITSYLADKK
jgi:A/G-specific adenine glycosylase